MKYILNRIHRHTYKQQQWCGLFVDLKTETAADFSAMNEKQREVEKDSFFP